MIHHTLPVAVLGLLAVGPLRSLHGQVAAPIDTGHRVVTVGLGFFLPQAVGLIGERFFLNDRFSAVVTVATPFCVGCTEAQPLYVAGGLRVFGDLPPVPYFMPSGLSRVFLELHVGPMAMRRSPYQLYNGIGIALGIEGGDPKTGLSVGANLGLGWLFNRRKCLDALDKYECIAGVASAYLAWTVWR